MQSFKSFNPIIESLLQEISFNFNPIPPSRNLIPDRCNGLLISIFSPLMSLQQFGFSTRVTAMGIFVVDDTLPGALVSLENHKRIFAAFCTLSPSVKSRATKEILLSRTRDFGTTLRMELMGLGRRIQSGERIVLYFVLNGHSYLYRNDEATQHAAAIGETPFLARDGTTIRFSTFRYANQDLITPRGMQRILDLIRSVGVMRTILFLDTCHSMSLVSVLLCPAIDIRILHSTGEEEKTWQASDLGSVMSHAWALASEKEVSTILQVHRQSPKKANEMLRTAFWHITQLVAQTISSQVLTTGPSQALWIY